jgi:PAS domain S-box-containing protein
MKVDNKSIASEELKIQIKEKNKQIKELIKSNLGLNMSEKLLHESIKEISEYIDVLNETSIIGMTDAKGIFTKVNKNFCNLTKYDETELLGKHFSKINSEHHTEGFLKELWTTISEGKIWKGEKKNKAKDGTMYWVELTVIPFLDKKGKPYQYLTLKTDISKRKATEEELNIVNINLALQKDEIEKRASELNVTNKELALQIKEKEKLASELILANKELKFQNKEKEKRAAELIQLNKELESFNYISSHDLHEPLRHIQSFASRIISDEYKNLSEKGNLYFEKINSAANRMQVLLDDLLVYSRTTNEKRKFEMTNLNDIVMNIENEFKETMDEKQAVIEFSDLGSANIILFQFRQLMYNLIGNSLKFTKQDTPPLIKISSRIVLNTIEHTMVNDLNLLQNIEYYHITICDNGIGFESQYKDRIFEIFQRLGEKKKIAGTGIGLAIVKKIVDNHKGYITATSALNEGACFDIYIPLN